MTDDQLALAQDLAYRPIGFAITQPDKEAIRALLAEAQHLRRWQGDFDAVVQRRNRVEADVERLTRALGKTQEQIDDCTGADDGVPCASHLAYEDAEREIGQLKAERDELLAESQRHRDNTMGALQAAGELLAERDQLLADLRAIAAAITEPAADLPSKYLEVKIAGPILDLVRKYRGAP